MRIYGEKTRYAHYMAYFILALLSVPHVLYLLQPFFMDERAILQNVSAFVMDSTIIPRHTNYPTLYSYITTPFVMLGLVINYFIGDFTSLNDAYRYLYHLEQKILIMPARVITFGMLIGTGVVIARFCWDRYGVFAAFFIFSLFMISPAFLEYGSYGLPDISMMFFSVVSLVYTVKFLECGEKNGLLKNLILASVFSGFAISTKYSALSTVMPIGYSIIYLYFTQKVELKRMVIMVFLAAGVCVLAFILGSPGWVLKPQVFMSGLIAEIEHAKRGHMGFSGVPLLGNIELLIVGAPILTVSSVIGILLWLKNRDAAGWVALVAVVSTIVLAASSTKQSLHYMYPAFAGLFIFSSVFGNQLGKLNKVVLSAVLILVLFKPFINMYQKSLCFLKENTTFLTTVWMYDNIPEYSKVARDWAYVPIVFTQKKIDRIQRNEPPEIAEYLRSMYKVYDLTPLNASKKWLDETDAQYIVTSESIYKRFFEFGIFTRTNPSEDLVIHKAFKLRKEFYEELFKSTDWIEVFSVDTGNGPLTHVYQRRHEP